MALYKVVSQLLALVRWRAQAHLCVTTALMGVLNLKDPESAWGCGQWLRVRQVTRTPGGMTVTISLSGLVLKLTTTGMWPTWVVRLRLQSPGWLGVRWRWRGGAPGAWRPQPAPFRRAGAMIRAMISWKLWYQRAMISQHTDISNDIRGVIAW
jgi:hypothetical protein